MRKLDIFAEVGVKKYERKAFGSEYNIQFDTVIDHDTYKYMQVMYEVERGERNKSTLVLNGKPRGVVTVVRDPKTGRDIGFTAERLNEDGSLTLVREKPFKMLGEAGAAIITSYVI